SGLTTPSAPALRLAHPPLLLEGNNILAQSTQRKHNVPRRLSLLDIVNKFDLETLCDGLVELRRVQSAHEESMNWDTGAWSEKDKKDWTKYLHDKIGRAHV